MRGYYVYELIDPRTGASFYVGKGKGSRLLNHEAEAAKGISGPKCDRIREIWASGLQVEHEIVRTFDDQYQAYAFEAARIEKIGLSNLTNRVAGGYGGAAFNRRWTRSKFRSSAAILARWMHSLGSGDEVVIAEFTGDHYEFRPVIGCRAHIEDMLESAVRAFGLEFVNSALRAVGNVEVASYGGH